MDTPTSPSRRPTLTSKYGPPGLINSNDPSIAYSERVKKRNGKMENVSIAKIEQRIKAMSKGLNVNCLILAQEVIKGVYDGIRTSEIDRLAAGFAHEKITDHPDYDVLAARIIVSNHHKETIAPFSEVMNMLYDAKQINHGFIKVVEEHADRIDSAIDYDRDYLFTYFGFRTFETSYGLRIKEPDRETGEERSVVYERPQHMWMRVALAMHLDDLDAAIESYEWMSCMYFTHASPTLFSAGKRRQQLSSCFLIAMREDKDSEHPDSIEGIYGTLKRIAKISKSAGGIGMHCSTIRAEGSPITSAGCASAGIIPMLKPFEATVNYVDQERKRKGAMAVYIEPFHADFEDFLAIKSNTGDETRRMRDLHLAVWMCDEFMRRVEADEIWSFMCPFYSLDLIELYGDAFDKRYREYEAMGKPYVRRQVRARDVWSKIVDSQIHTGEPYIVYKDAVNRRTNHQNLGTVRSSNLCVAPYTRILTRHGYQSVGSLKDQSIDIWNGFEWSEVTVRQTGENKSLVRVSLSNGSVLDCTPEHQFYIQTAYSGDTRTNLEVFQSSKNVKKISAQELKLGDKLIKHDLPKDVGFIEHIGNRDALHFTKVLSVEEINGTFDTYCFTEPKLGLGMFEGIVTGQCAEIVQFSDSDHTATCNLSSISLKSFVIVDPETDQRTYDFETLRYVVRIVTRNLDKVIDINDYPTKEAKRSNLRERPMGIGVQGLADAYVKMRIPFDSPEASKLNREIFETMYFASVEASCELAKEAGEPYPSYHMNGGCPMSHGKFQFDLWRDEGRECELSGMWDWEGLRVKIVKYGVRNSLSIALMPTASTSQLLGNNESFEMYTNNIYVRTTLSGSFKVVNQQLIRDLIDEGIWTEELKNKVIYLGGSIKELTEIPKRIRDLYPTAFDTSQKVIIDQAAERSPFIDQSQSLNIHMSAPTYAAVSSMHMYGWKKGLKTGQYYLRSQPAKRAAQVTVDPQLAADIERQISGKNTAKEVKEDAPPVQEDGWVCNRDEGCMACGS